MLKNSPSPSSIPATHPSGLSNAGPTRSVPLIILYPTSPLILFRRLFKTAVGPDGHTMHHLKNLGSMGIQYLIYLFNQSLNHCNIPAIWKHAITTRITKPGKPTNLGTSYRPISLLRLAVKVLERLLHPELSSVPLSSSQHGLRPTTPSIPPSSLLHKI